VALSGFLKTCAETERLVGAFYADLAERFRGFPRAAELFRQLSGEEEAHARVFEFLRSVASRLDEQTTIAPTFLQNVERLRRGLEKAASALIPDDGEAGLREAIGTAILVESTTLERDKTAFVQVENQEFRDLLHGLVASDESHRGQLAALRDDLADAGNRSPADARRAVG
jgi:rubrerythrin